MPDDAKQLRATLTRLHEQLGALAHVNPEQRERLETALADIHRMLDEGAGERGGAAKAQAAAGEQESIVERLSAAERHFEQTHPTLAGIVGSVINALSRMGI